MAHTHPPAILPPEIVHMIVQMLAADRETLGACALAVREFTFPALCSLGRHIAVNTTRRLRECASLLTTPSAFRHVRSLDLGITTTAVIRKRDWDDYLRILQVFARRRTLTRLWLSRLSFCFPKLGEQAAITDIIVSLAATVNELGLYSCRFSCYAEVVSLIRAFPLCTSLFVRDCVSRKTPGADLLAKLPQHTLRVTELELTSSSCHRYLVDVSNLVEDAALDISSLTGFSCDMSTADVARHTLMAAAASPIERLHLACDEALGFHGEFEPPKTADVALIASSKFSRTQWWQPGRSSPSPSAPSSRRTINGASAHRTSPPASRIWTPLPYSALTDTRSYPTSGFGRKSTDCSLAETFSPVSSAWTSASPSGPNASNTQSTSVSPSTSPTCTARARSIFGATRRPPPVAF
jgi:hypothetical protein